MAVLGRGLCVVPVSCCHCDDVLAEVGGDELEDGCVRAAGVGVDEPDEAGDLVVAGEGCLKKVTTDGPKSDKTNSGKAVTGPPEWMRANLVRPTTVSPKSESRPEKGDDGRAEVGVRERG